jgi:hypothetical protein
VSTYIPERKKIAKDDRRISEEISAYSVTAKSRGLQTETILVYVKEQNGGSL